MMLTKQKRAILAHHLTYECLYPDKKKRRWTIPLVETRLLQGVFSTLLGSLKEDPVKFFNYFKMSISTFNELEGRLEDSLRKQDTVMRQAVRPIEMLAVTIRYLASGCSMKDLHREFRLGHSTIANIIRRVCRVVWEELYDDCLPTCSKEDWLGKAKFFLDRANFPHCIGAIDGKHVRLAKPSTASVLFFVVADTEYRFICVEVESTEGETDCTLFDDAKLHKMLGNGQAEIPEPELIQGTDIMMPYNFVGDKAFSLSPCVLRPFAGKTISKERQIFNFRLNRAHRYAECALAILTNKWNIFHRAMDVNVDLAIAIVRCCCILHNFVIARDGYKFEDTLVITGLYNNDSDRIKQSGQILNRRRNKLAEYFATAGAIPLQNHII